MKIKEKKINNYIKAIITTLALFLDVEKISEIKSAVIPYNGDLLIMLITGMLIYKLYKEINNKSYTSVKVLSGLFSFFMIFGNSYMKTNSWNLVFGSPLLFVISIMIFYGYFIFYKVVLTQIYNVLKNMSFKNESEGVSKFRRLFDEHPFLFSLGIILLCWLPYIISFYPAILSPDPSFQIKQFFGIDNKYSTYSILIDPNVIITNHHPVLHTLLLGGCVNIGKFIGSVNVGLFIYSAIQISILSSVLSYTICYMKKLNIPYCIRKYSLILYALLPVFPLYAMSAVKDVIFGSLIILYIIMIYDFIKNVDQVISVKKMAYSILLMILLALFRNNGIYVIILSFPILIIISVKNRLRLGIIFLALLSLYTTYSKVILPAFKITPGSVREILSIPFQQTARYVKKYEGELSESEKQTIDNVLGIDDLAKRYKPEISDPVKNGFNRYATKDDLSNYFKVWFNGLIRHPNVYIEATANNIYGYFYPNKTSWYVYYKFDDRIVQDGFDYHYNNLESSRTLLSNFAIMFPYIPIVGLIVNIGFNVWVLFIMVGYLINIKRYKEITFLAPALILLLVCIASPVNAYFRYTLPFVFAMPLMIGIFIDINRSGDNKYERK